VVDQVALTMVDVIVGMTIFSVVMTMMTTLAEEGASP
jgi:hypothetical protein